MRVTMDHTMTTYHNKTDLMKSMATVVLLAHQPLYGETDLCVYWKFIVKSRHCLDIENGSLIFRIGQTREEFAEFCAELARFAVMLDITSDKSQEDEV